MNLDFENLKGNFLQYLINYKGLKLKKALHKIYKENTIFSSKSEILFSLVHHYVGVDLCS